MDTVMDTVTDIDTDPVTDTDIFPFISLHFVSLRFFRFISVSFLFILLLNSVSLRSQTNFVPVSLGFRFIRKRPRTLLTNQLKDHLNEAAGERENQLH
jgi:hypothetical protein